MQGNKVKTTGQVGVLYSTERYRYAYRVTHATIRQVKSKYVDKAS